MQILSSLNLIEIDNSIVFNPGKWCSVASPENVVVGEWEAELLLFLTL